MRYQPASCGLWVFLALCSFAVLSDCHRNGQQVVGLKTPHRSQLLKRAVFAPAVSAPDDEYDSPVAYDFGSPDASPESTAFYPSPTDTAGEPSSDPSSTPSPHPATATTEPRSPGISNGPEIESTSAVTQLSPNGGSLPSSATSLFDSSQDAASQTGTRQDETVTVTVTNFISSTPTTTDLESSLPSTNSSVSSAASDADVSVITITSLHTITLSNGRTSSTAAQTSTSLSTSHKNVTSTVGTISSQNTTSMDPLTTSGVSIITITRTETYTGMSNATAGANNSVTSKEATTSTIEWPTPISRLPPFSASFNFSSVPWSVTSSSVSGVTSTSPEATTHTVFQNVTVTLSELSGTNSQITEATRTPVPTSPTSSNVTSSVSSAQNTTSLSSLSTSTKNLSTTKVTPNSTVSETLRVSISTEVVTVTVYPEPPETTASANEASVLTLHTTSTMTVTLTPFPLSNASLSAFPTSGGFTTTSSGPLSTGSAGDWTTSLPTVSTNSTVIGTLLNTTTTWSSTDGTEPSYVETPTCEHTHATSRPASTTETGAGNSSSSIGTTSRVTYPSPSTFRTTVSPTSWDDEEPGYPTPSRSPGYPWGGSGPLHRVQEPGF
ncbi:hypothetical protein A9K55_005605 [Cordyceps militaris]|uniref:Uncharacterized protein n=1 Tax=Cordyceps militaris TaxID=73501 RepID=A0A2H4SD73_CORMI|nr:hypothetical protein A9K55_005605 [Cordyceps militaris]